MAHTKSSQLAEATFEVEGSVSSASSLDDLVEEHNSTSRPSASQVHASALEKTSKLQIQHQQVVAGRSASPAHVTEAAQHDIVYDRDYRLPSSFASGGGSYPTTTYTNDRTSSKVESRHSPHGIGQDRDYRLPSSFFSGPSAGQQQQPSSHSKETLSGTNAADGRDCRLSFSAGGGRISQPGGAPASFHSSSTPLALYGTSAVTALGSGFEVHLAGGLVQPSLYEDFYPPVTGASASAPEVHLTPHPPGTAPGVPSTPPGPRSARNSASGAALAAGPAAGSIQQQQQQQQLPASQSTYSSPAAPANPGSAAVPGGNSPAKQGAEHEESSDDDGGGLSDAESDDSLGVSQLAELVYSTVLTTNAAGESGLQLDRSTLQLRSSSQLPPSLASQGGQGSASTDAGTLRTASGSTSEGGSSTGASKVHKPGSGDRSSAPLLTQHRPSRLLNLDGIQADSCQGLEDCITAPDAPLSSSGKCTAAQAKSSTSVSGVGQALPTGDTGALPSQQGGVVTAAAADVLCASLRTPTAAATSHATPAKGTNTRSQPPSGSTTPLGARSPLSTTGGTALAPTRLTSTPGTAAPAGTSGLTRRTSTTNTTISSTSSPQVTLLTSPHGAPKSEPHPLLKGLEQWGAGTPASSSTPGSNSATTPKSTPTKPSKAGASSGPSSTVTQSTTGAKAKTAKATIGHSNAGSKPSSTPAKQAAGASPASKAAGTALPKLSGGNSNTSAAAASSTALGAGTVVSLQAVQAPQTVPVLQSSTAVQPRAMTPLEKYKALSAVQSHNNDLLAGRLSAPALTLSLSTLDEDESEGHHHGLGGVMPAAASQQLQAERSAPAVTTRGTTTPATGTTKVSSAGGSGARALPQKLRSLKSGPPTTGQGWEDDDDDDLLLSSSDEDDDSEHDLAARAASQGAPTGSTTAGAVSIRGRLVSAPGAVISIPANPTSDSNQSPEQSNSGNPTASITDLAPPPPALYSLVETAGSRVATPTLRPAACSAGQVTAAGVLPPKSSTAVPMGLGVGLSKQATPAGPQTPSSQRRAALLGKGTVSSPGTPSPSLTPRAPDYLGDRPSPRPSFLNRATSVRGSTTGPNSSTPGGSTAVPAPHPALAGLTQFESIRGGPALALQKAPSGVLASPKDATPPEPVLETPDMSAAALRRKLPAAFLKRLSMPGDIGMLTASGRLTFINKSRNVAGGAADGVSAAAANAVAWADGLR